MKQNLAICLLLMVLSACNNSGTKANSGPLNYDGVYQSQPKSETGISEKHFYYIRFYPDGKVCTVTSTGTPEQIKSWFNMQNQNVSKGTYQINDKHLSFSTSDQSGTVNYDGTIEDNTLRLNSISQANNAKQEDEFTFVGIDEWR